MVPIRKEKAEIEALTATVEKMRLDHDAALRKHRANENRLQTLAGKQLQQVEEQQKMLLSLEEERQLLLEFIEAQGLLLPKQLRARVHERLLRAGTTGGASVGQLKSKVLGADRPAGSKYLGDRGYAEEVDVQMVRGSSRTVSAGSGQGIASHSPATRVGSDTARGSSVTNRSSREQHRGSYSEEEEYQTADRPHFLDESVDHRLADAVFSQGASLSQTSRHSTAPRSRPSTAAASGHASTLPGEVFSKLANNIRSPSAPRSGAGALSRTVQRSNDFEQQQTASRPTTGNRASSAHYNSGDLSSNRTSNAALTNTSASWARSSRSSASRYSRDDDGEGEFGAEPDSYEAQLLQRSRESESRAEQNAAALSETYRSQRSPPKSPAAPPSVLPPSSPQGQRSPQQRDNLASSHSAPTSHAATDNPLSQSIDTGNSRTEQLLPDGSRVVLYRNGTKKKIAADGSSVVLFSNGDSKHTETSSGVVTYYYKEADTTHTTYPDLTEVYEFPNKQVSCADISLLFLCEDL